MEVDTLPNKSSDSSGKFVVALGILDSLMSTTKEKIILVSYSTKVQLFYLLLFVILLKCFTRWQMLDLFGEACTERQYRYLRLDGSTPTSARMGLVDRLNDPQGQDRNSHFTFQFGLAFLFIIHLLIRNFFAEL